MLGALSSFMGGIGFTVLIYAVGILAMVLSVIAYQFKYRVTIIVVNFSGQACCDILCSDGYCYGGLLHEGQVELCIVKALLRGISYCYGRLLALDLCGLEGRLSVACRCVCRDCQQSLG